MREAQIILFISAFFDAAILLLIAVYDEKTEFMLFFLTLMHINIIGAVIIKAMEELK